MLSIGIVGLPNVGKSTIFRALTSAPAEASNYPFCTIDPNIGVVTVPDNRLEALAEIIHPERIIPTAIQFVDIAGLISGAHKGEGLGNQFLANIRECDAVAEVVRFFEDDNVIHVAGGVDPHSDMETISYELALSDLETVEKRLKALQREARNDKKLEPKLQLTQTVAEALAEGKPARAIATTDEQREMLQDLHLLTLKPHIYIANVNEDAVGDTTLSERLGAESEVVPVCAKVEAELAELDDEDAAEYREELGYQESGLSGVIRKGYELLELISYFTAGEKEVRAWTVHKGATAPEGAGVIHTDFQRGFIKADVIDWSKLVDSGSWANARTTGDVRIEGKEYIVNDGDVMLFKFNV